MQVTFVGGPWNGESQTCPDPLPDAIAGPGHAVYLPWHAHPAIAGVIAEPSSVSHTFVAAAIGTRDLLREVEDIERRRDAQDVRLQPRRTS